MSTEDVINILKRNIGKVLTIGYKDSSIKKGELYLYSSVSESSAFVLEIDNEDNHRVKTEQIAQIKEDY